MNANHLGGPYLKAHHLKTNTDGTSRHNRTGISGRNGGPRILPAKTEGSREFGPQLEIPIELDGQEFVVSVPADKGDGKALQAVFGQPSPEWAGKAVDVFASETIADRIRIVPIG